MSETNNESNNSTLSRRDFLKAASVAIGGLFFPSKFIQNMDGDKESSKEGDNFEPLLIQKTTKIEAIPQLEGDTRQGVNRILFDKNGGAMYYKGNSDDYNELEVFGTLLPLGNPNSLDSWKKNKENSLQGVELFWIWGHPNGTIESQNMVLEPAIGYLIDANVQVMPDIKYSICDVVKNENGDKELVFSQTRLDKLLEIAGNNVLGFAFDEPVEGLEVNENLIFDQVKFIKEYGKACALPIQIITAGKQNFEYIHKLYEVCTENNVFVIGGSDVYPFMYESYSHIDDMLTSLKIQPNIWDQEFLEKNSTVTSCLVLAAHDQFFLGNKTVINSFDNMEDNGNNLPLNKDISGFAKLKIWEIVTALSVNPNYSRITWWTNPFGMTNTEPYALTGPGILETIKILTPAIPFINGKTIDRGNSNNCDFSIKEIKSDIGEVYKAAFIHINQKGSFPRIRLDSNKNYIDVISNKTFKTDLLGFVIPQKQSQPLESVLCLVPAEKK